MLYKFKSKATGDLIMLEPNARQMLAIIGKDTHGAAAGKGILQVADMPAAQAALEAAVAQNELERKSAIEAAEEKGEAAPRFEAVSLRQRAVPLLDMIRRCHKAGHDIVWGV